VTEIVIGNTWPKNGDFSYFIYNGVLHEMLNKSIDDEEYLVWPLFGVVA